MPRPTRGHERYRKWDAKVTPEHWAFLIRQTKDIALDRVAQFQSAYDHVISVVRDVVAKYNLSPAESHKYVGFALKVFHCLGRHAGDALRRCATAAVFYYIALGGKYEALYEIATRLGARPYLISELLEALGLMPWRVVGLNRSDGPHKVTATETARLAGVRLERDVYVEGVYVEARNPAGSKAALTFRVAARVLVDGREEAYTLSPIVRVDEGTEFSDYLRYIYDAIPDGGDVVEIYVEGALDREPQPGLEPTVKIAVYGVRFERQY